MDKLLERVENLTAAQRAELWRKLRASSQPQHAEASPGQLVAYVVVDPGHVVDAQQLLGSLANALPSYMLPGAIELVESLPRTSTGKIDRASLAERRAAARAARHVPPRNADEELLAGIWRQILGLDDVGVHDDFFALGGHSLLATQIVVRVRELLGVELPLRALFEHRSIAGLASHLQHARLDALAAAELRAPVVPVPHDRALPLSSAQRRLWFLHELDPDSTAYTVPSAVVLTGRLDVMALEKSLHEIVDRHRILRTTFHRQDGVPVQSVHPSGPVRLRSEQIHGDSPAAREAALQRRVLDEAQRAFDLARGPLCRFRLFRMTEDEHVLCVTAHHIVVDGWSTGVFLRELAALYEAFCAGRASPLAPLPIQYADFAVWQARLLASEALDPQLDYWKTQLAGAPDALALPTDRPRPPSRSFHGAKLAFELPAELRDRALALCRQENITLSMLLLSAWAVVLHRYAGARDLVIGTPVANRMRAETEALIGCFVNTLALRLRPRAALTFAELVAQVRETALEAYANQDLPFEQVIEAAQPQRSLGQNPIFQVLFALQNTPMPALQLADVAIRPLALDHGAAQLDLSLFFSESQGALHGLFEYDTALFDSTTIARMAGHVRTVLEAVVQDESQRLSTLPLLTQHEHAQLAAWNRTAVDFGAAGTIVDWIEARVRECPDALALVYEQQSLSYRALNQRANRLAHHLQKRGVGADALVGVYAHRSIEMVVALLAVLKAGGAYMPFDPDYPEELLAFMLGDARPRVLLAQDELAGSLPPGVDVLRLTGDWDAIEAERDDDPVRAVWPDSLAYVIYTSGSTGRPKGAMNTLRGLSNRLAWMQARYGLTSRDRVLQKTSFSFDVSVWEYFWPLMAGATLVMARPGGHRDSRYLVDVIQEQGITTIHFVPSMLQLIVTEPGFASCTSLQRVICSGEALSPRLCADFFRRQQAQLHNLYGPTEAAIDVTAWHCQPGAARVPIGTPIANTQIYLLDDAFEHVPIGVPGELCIGGVNVGRGYLARPDLTAERFVPDPFSGQPGARMYRTGDLARYLPDGTIEFIGRRDHQVKVRGFRVELAGIEAVLGAHPGVRRAAVLVKTDTLVAYVAPGGERPQASELSAYLTRQLPPFMVPQTFMYLDAMPMLPSGKIDRAALAALSVTSEANARAYQAPRTRTERVLVDIWQALLEIETVGIDDSFFDLGGHSLLALRMCARIRDRIAVDLSVRVVFEGQTIRGIAAEIERVRASAGPGTPGTSGTSGTEQDHGSEAGARGVTLFGARLEPVGERAHYELSPYQLPEWYMHELAPHDPVYNVSNSNQILRGDLDVDALLAAWNALIARHAALRTSFGFAGGKPVQRIRPHLALTRDEFYIDRTSVPEDQQDREVYDLILRHGHTIFDFEQGPIHLLKVAELPGKRFLLIVVSHHIIWDEFCTMIVARELSALYNAFRAGRKPALAPLPFEYVDFAHGINRAIAEGRLDHQRRYWLSKFDPLPPPLDLPLDRPRPELQSFNGATVSGHIPPETYQALQAFLKDNGTTLYIFLLAVLNTQLHLLTGQRDFVVGTPIANRNHDLLEGIVGCFATAMPMRCQIRAGMTFAELLAATQQTALEAYDNHAYPSILAIQELNPAMDPSRGRLFSVMYGVQNNKTNLMRNLMFDGLELDFITEVPSPEFDRAKFDFSLVVDQFGDVINLEWTHNTDIFNWSTIERMMAQFLSLILQVIHQPDEKLTEYRLLQPAEERRILVELNDTSTFFREPACLPQRLAEQARQSPDALALELDGGALTYRQLHEAVQRWADVLLAEGCEREEKIGVLLQPSPELIIAILAILEAGAAYVPLSCDYPAERLCAILQSAGARRVIGGSPGPRWSGQVLSPAELYDRGRLLDEPRPRRHIEPGNLAYVLFTSGTTGVPKGIEIEHRGILNLIDSTQQRYSLTAQDAVLMLTPASFDASVLDLFWPLSVGARVVVPQPGAEKDPVRIAEYITRKRISMAQFVPAMLSALIDIVEEDDAQDLSSLRVLISGGAFLGRELCERVRDLLPGVLMNHYGPTEVTVDATCFDCAESFDGSIVPIGRPIANTRVYILDDRMRPVPVGATGEILVSSPGLARGYLDDPVTTALRFVPDPFSPTPGARLYRTGDLGKYSESGVIHFMGRRDKQVKIRGNRVELEEIEARLTSHPAIEHGFAQLGEGEALIAYIEMSKRANQISNPHGIYRIFTLAQRPELRKDFDRLHLDAWPAYFAGNAAMRQYWPRLNREFADSQIVLLGKDDHVVAAGNAIPMCWNGTLADLPAGWDDGIERAFQQAQDGKQPDTLMILAGVVDEEHLGRGLATSILQGFKKLARALGLARVIVPVRPTGKARHPDATFGDWVERRRADGQLEDDWLRIHERVGGRFLCIAERSQLVRGTLAEWQEWTGMTFTRPGAHTVPGALQPVHVDIAAGEARYFDPSVWLEHTPAEEGPNGLIRPADLREFVRQLLPEHMVPAYLRFVTEIPRTPSGKLDERALRELHAEAQRASRQHVPPRNERERALAALWADILGVEDIGVMDDFFEIGGHSISAVRMLAAVASKLGASVALRDFYLARTIAGLAQLVET